MQFFRRKKKVSLERFLASGENEVTNRITCLKWSSHSIGLECVLAVKTKCSGRTSFKVMTVKRVRQTRVYNSMDQIGKLKVPS